MNNDEKFGCIKIDEIQVCLDEMTDEELAKIEEEIVKAKTELRKIIDETLEIGEIATQITGTEVLDETIKKIIEKQYQHSIVKATRTVKRSRNLISADEMQLEKYINEQAKKYGQSRECLNGEIEQYKECIEEINNKLNIVRKCLMAQKEELQNSEYENIMVLSKKREERKILKKSEEYKEYRTQINNINRDLMKEMENETPSDTEIKRLTAEIEKMEAQDELVLCEREMQELKKSIIEIRKIVIEIDKEISQFTINLKDYIESATQNSNLPKGAADEENFIKKIFNIVFNKIGGANKFEELVVKNIKSKIEKMKTINLPEVLKKIQIDSIESLSGIIEKIQKMQGIPEGQSNTKEIANDELIISREEFRVIIDSGNDKRKMCI